jgi:hypothetical protein
MPGMNSGLNLNDPAVVQAFKTLLLHQGIIALLVFASLGMAWVSARAWLGVPADAAPSGQPAEPGCRKVLRIGFGVLWLVDGILQAQPSMAIGLPSKVSELAGLGAERGELGRDLVVIPSHAGRRRRRVDPGWHRHLDADCDAGPVIEAQRAGGCRVGPHRVGVR